MRRRKATVELFEALRREYEFGVGTIQGVARKFGVHRRLVREAIGNAVPKTKPATPRARPRLAPLIPFIDRILAEDRRAPRKQRHTTHQIFVRLGIPVSPPVIQPQSSSHTPVKPVVEIGNDYSKSKNS